jgi:hypothetical protein
MPYITVCVGFGLRLQLLVRWYHACWPAHGVVLAHCSMPVPRAPRRAHARAGAFARIVLVLTWKATTVTQNGAIVLHLVPGMSAGSHSLQATGPCHFAFPLLVKQTTPLLVKQTTPLLAKQTTRVSVHAQL